MTPYAIAFERLCAKIRKDGEQQSGPSMLDVEKLITLSSLFVRLLPLFDTMASNFEQFAAVCEEMGTELDEGFMQ